MLTISADQMLQDAARFLELVESGETLVITCKGAPIAELKPAATAPAQRRPIGLCAGEFVVPADFDDPLSDDLLDAFEGR